MGHLQVVEPGLSTIVQDRGRYGWESIGVARGGALDAQAYIWANRLARNAHDVAVLEMLLLGPTLLALDDCFAATTGTTSVSVDGISREPWSSFPVRAGSTLSIHSLAGARGYLAVRGGIDVDVVLGSRSTHLEGGFGGFHGRALRRGDVLPVGEAAGDDEPGVLRLLNPPVSRFPATIRVVPGPHDAEMPPGAMAALLSTVYTVSPHSNHVGLRLKGKPVGAPSGIRVSEPMPVGAVQVPPDGSPIVLLNGRGTIGGYPVAAVVITPDTWVLGQARPGDEIRFEAVSLEDGQAMTREALQKLASIDIEEVNSR